MLRVQFPVNQILVQVPAALFFCLLAFIVWSWLVKLFLDRLVLRQRSEYLLVYVGALLWGVVIFVPLHYVTQGYLTSLANVLGLWAFQIPANLAVLALTRFAARFPPL